MKIGRVFNEEKMSIKPKKLSFFFGYYYWYLFKKNFMAKIYSTNEIASVDTEVDNFGYLK